MAISLKDATPAQVIILDTKIPGFRQNEILKWLRNNAPNLWKEASIFHINSEVGRDLWLELTQKGIRTVPQIYIKEAEKLIHIGEFANLIAWHEQKREPKEELCET